MVELNGSNALVTGAAGGLGRYISRALAAQGANLVLSDLPGDGLDVRGETRSPAFGTTVEAVAADLAKQGQRRELIEKAEQALGPIDVLVNNAGVEFVGPVRRGAARADRPDHEGQLARPDGADRGSRCPGCSSARRGHIVNIASLAGKTPLAYFHTYNATKYGIVGFSHAIRHELTDEPVSASVICPGFIEREGMYGRIEREVEDGEPARRPRRRRRSARRWSARSATTVRRSSSAPARSGRWSRSPRPSLRPAIWLNERIGARQTAREFGEAQGRF